jgi:hypothetical protein
VTIAFRVLEELRRCGKALDDEDLAARLGVSARQTINQVCRRLAVAGRLNRYVGPAGKIVNDLRLGAGRPPAGEQPPSGEVTPSHTSDSREQHQAERIMLDLLGTSLGVVLNPMRLVLDDGVRVEVDGADEERSILVEAWAHQGQPKVAQKHKVLADALKLLHIASTLPVAPRLVLCLSDHDAAQHFTTARSWAAHALRGFGIEVIVVDLPPGLKASIADAQRRQFR